MLSIKYKVLHSNVYFLSITMLSITSNVYFLNIACLTLIFKLILKLIFKL